MRWSEEAATGGVGAGTSDEINHATYGAYENRVVMFGSMLTRWTPQDPKPMTTPGGGM